MQVLFQAGSNTSTNGVAIGNAGDASGDVVVKKVIVGSPVNSGNIWIYHITNPVNAATTNIAFKKTYGGTVAETSPYMFDFTSPDCPGLQLTSGGNLIIDQTMNVTVLWDYIENKN